MLNVNIYSFSYKKSGIPHDNHNGGGFVFDCRFIYNPGREEKFINLTGQDKDLIEFLDKNDVMKKFLTNVYSIVDDAVDNYLVRNFTNLQVSFGCTGGQHRSIYASEQLHEHLLKKYSNKIQLNLTHSEFPKLSS